MDASLVAVHDTTTLAQLMPSGGVHPIAFMARLFALRALAAVATAFTLLACLANAG
jgi:hypothetical protein